MGSRQPAVAGMRVVMATCVLACTFAIAIPASSEGGVVKPTPVSVKRATSPFLTRGYRLLPNLMSGRARWIVAKYVIYLPNARASDEVGRLEIYKNAYWANRQAARTATSQFRPFAWRVANVVLYVDYVGSTSRVQNLVSALRKLGMPLRLY